MHSSNNKVDKMGNGKRNRSENYYDDNQKRRRDEDRKHKRKQKRDNR